MREIQIFPDPGQLMQAAAQHFVTLAQTAIEQNGWFTVSLSGGSTPRALYALLASPPFAGQVNWERVNVFWGDERCVPPDHPDSDYGMAYDALLRHIPVPEANIYRMVGEIDPLQAAAQYRQILRETFATSPPVFDLILLGMGTDGHTASLFPGTPAIYEQHDMVVGHFVGKLNAWRITFTPPLINAAANVVFLVSGAEKAETVHDVLEGVFQPHTLLSQIVAPHNGRLLWMLDDAAAARLR